MAHASAVVRQSSTVLGAAAAVSGASSSSSMRVGGRQATKKLLRPHLDGCASSREGGGRGPSIVGSQKRVSVLASSSSLPSPAWAGRSGAVACYSDRAGGHTEGPSHTVRTIPPSFFRSASPFVYKGSKSTARSGATASDDVEGEGSGSKSGAAPPASPELEPFGLRVQQELRDELLHALQDEDAGPDVVWDAYEALSRAPTVDDVPERSTTVVNLLPFLKPGIHRAVMRKLVPRTPSGHALQVYLHRKAQAQQEALTPVGYRALSQRPERRRHLQPPKLTWAANRAGGWGPFVLEQMRLARLAWFENAPPDEVWTEEEKAQFQFPTTRDYNDVLAILAEAGHVVPLSQVWCMLLEHAATGDGVAPSTRSYALVVRGLYAHMQIELHRARLSHSLTKLRRRKQVLRRATFQSEPEAAQAEGLSPGDVEGLAGYPARRVKYIFGRPEEAATITSLGVQRLQTILDSFSRAQLSNDGLEGGARFWRKYLFDHALRILRLGGDLQQMAILLRREFGVRLGHPDVVDGDAPAPDGFLSLTIDTLNTILMALGEHATAQDMVVAYESLTRPLPPRLPAGQDELADDKSTPSTPKWQSAADEEEDEGLLGLGSGGGSTSRDSAPGQGASKLFQLDWSALSLKQQAATIPEASISTSLSAAHAERGAQLGTSMVPYTIHPTTTTLRSMVRNMCSKSRPVAHMYATLTRTPLPRGDWDANRLPSAQTEGQLRRLALALRREDHDRQDGRYLLLAMAYMREGVAAYRNSLAQMAIALQPVQPAEAREAAHARLLQPPPLVPTAVCFRPVITRAASFRKPALLRDLLHLVEESAALMGHEREVLASARAYWISEVALARRREFDLVGRSEEDEGEEDVAQRRVQLQQRRMVLAEIMQAIVRQDEHVRREVRALYALLHGREAAFQAETSGRFTWQAVAGQDQSTQPDAKDGEPADGDDGFDVDGEEPAKETSALDERGLLGLLDAVRRRRRERRKARMDQVDAYYEAEAASSQGDGAGKGKGKGKGKEDIAGAEAPNPAIEARAKRLREHWERREKWRRNSLAARLKQSCSVPASAAAAAEKKQEKSRSGPRADSGVRSTFARRSPTGRNNGRGGSGGDKGGRGASVDPSVGSASSGGLSLRSASPAQS